MRNGQPKRVLLLCDHKRRDLPGLVLVKVWLESKYGYKVMISPVFGKDPYYVLGFQPHLIAYNHLRHKDRVEWVREIIKPMGMHIAVIPTEGQPQNEELQTFVAGKYSDLSVVDLHFVWGPGMQELMIEHQTVAPERTAVCGVPRFDFYRPPYNQLLPSKEAFCQTHGLDPSRPLVAWTTNFRFARFARDGVDSLERGLRRSQVDKLPSFRDAESLAQGDRESQLMAMDAFAKLARKHTEVNFVIKPHPFEDIGPYENLIRSLNMSTVTIAADVYIWDVLNAADIVLQRSCTTGVEAWMLDKPVLELQIPGESFLSSEELVAGSDIVVDFAELEERVAHYLHGGEIAPELLAARERYLAKWFYKIDGKSAERHADVIHAYLESHPSRLDMNWDWGKMAVFAKYHLRNILGIDHIQALRPWTKTRLTDRRESLGIKDSVITQQDVRDWEARIQKVLFKDR